MIGKEKFVEITKDKLGIGGCQAFEEDDCQSTLLEGAERFLEIKKKNKKLKNGVFFLPNSE